MRLSLKGKTRGFYATLLICFGLLGGLAINRMTAVSHESEVMESVWTPRMRLSDALGAAAREYRISESLRILSVDPDMVSHAETEIRDNAEVFDTKLAQYRAALNPKENKADVENIEAMWRDYRTSNREMLALAQAGKTAEATDRFRNSASRFYLLVNALDELSDLNVAQNAKARVLAETIAADARWIMWMSMAFVAVLLVSAALFFELKVWRVLDELSRVMQRLAHGDFSVKVIDATRRDEIGDMSRAVQVFKDNGLEVQRLEAQSAAHAQAVAEERRRNDDALALVDAQRAFVVATLATGLAELSRGDVTFRINEDFAPEFRKLRDDFNAAMDQIQEAMTQIKGGILGIRAGAGEISQSAEDLSRRTEQQAASLEETAAALDQITNTIRRNAEGSAEASKVALAATTDAERSGIVVRDAVHAMSEIEQSARQISQIIGVIDEIAFQTNLLALNAGVEAARAGDAGRGFAVVASEVRALAQRSAAAAKEIKALISTSGQQVASGVQLVGQTGQALERILINIGEINILVAQFANSAAEQAGSLHEVNAAVDQMDHGTQQNAAMVEENTAASFALASEAQQLAELIDGFEIGDTVELPPVRRSAPLEVYRRRLRPEPALRRAMAGGAAAEAVDGDWQEL